MVITGKWSVESFLLHHFISKILEFMSILNGMTQYFSVCIRLALPNDCQLGKFITKSIY